MRQDFVDKLELELRAAGERRARPWRIARRQVLAPALATLGVLAIAVALAATVLRSEDTVPAQVPPRLIANTALVSQGGSMVSAFGSVWVADIANERLLRLDPRTRAVEARIPLGGRRVDRCRGRLGLGARERPAAAHRSVGQPRRRVDPVRRLGAGHDPRRAAASCGWRTRRRCCASTCDATRSRARCRPRVRASRPSEPPRTGGSSTSRAATAGSCASTRGRARSSRPCARRSAARSWASPAAPSSWPATPASRPSTQPPGAGAGLATSARRRVNNGTFDGTTVWVQATDRATTRDRLWRIDARTGHATGALDVARVRRGRCGRGRQAGVDDEHSAATSRSR